MSRRPQPRVRPGQDRSGPDDPSSTSVVAPSTSPAGDRRRRFRGEGTNGDNRLGGDDWDARIVDWLVKQFKNKNGTDLAQDKIARQRLQEAAEKAKIELSSASETQINLPYITQVVRCTWRRS